MKAVISRKELLSLIGIIQGIITAKPAIPILSNVLIEAKNDQLILSATDLTTSMISFADAKVIEEGAIALPARKFFQLIKEITSPQIKITCTTHDTAEITSISSHFKLKGMLKNEFPTIPDVSKAIQIPIYASTLKEMLSKTLFCAARDDSRYVLNGIYLNIDNRKAKFIATDGKRISRIHANLEVDSSFQGSYVLPLKAVEEMVKILPDDEQIVNLYLMHDKLFLESSNLTLITKLLSGKYPDVEKVIPENPSIIMSLHREELISLLRQVSLFTSDTIGSARFIFDDGQLQLTAMDKEIGEGNVTMPVDYFEKKLEIAFNPHYFMDILRHSKDETITFSIQDGYNPGLITDTTSAVFVIMPMRLENTNKSESNLDVSQNAILT